MMGLRLTEGVRLDRLEALTQAPWQTWMKEEVLADLIADGFMVRTDNVLAATAEGRRLLNPLLARLIAVDR